MFKDIQDFFNKAYENKIIVSNETDKTKKMLAAADMLFQKELKSNPILRSRIRGGQIKPGHISGVTLDEVNHLKEKKERPIIDLVQQGGGMFGIALLGYTYIMEKVGIRFHSHGGTSAGAINAALLAAIPNKIYREKSIFSTVAMARQATKSEVLTHIIANTDFSTFMDRRGSIGFFQKLLFKNFKSWKLWVPIALLSLIFLLGIYFGFNIIFHTKNGLSGVQIRYFDFIIGTFNVFAFLLLCYFLVIRALGTNFGINTGNVYYNWVDTLLHLLEIHNTKELKTRMQENAVNLSKNNKIRHTQPNLVLIAANLTHNKVVKLPDEAGAYWSNPWNINPAAYLRATMSLPFIFKVLIPEMRHYDVIEKTNKVSTKAKFVDGGMLSNFPIREFHQGKGELPRFPTFGVLLSSREQMKETPGKHTFWHYLGSYLKTFRNFYDNDFLLKNTETKQLVELVNTTKHNWLNFWMKDGDKEDLFVQGAIAALRQLEKFDWQKYKEERLKEYQRTQFK